jgi:hypothetical protein
VEAKAPDWEAELSETDRRQGRKVLGKYVDLEARAVTPFDVLMDVIGRNAAPKLLPGTPNLMVTADQLFVSIVGMPYPEAGFGNGLPGVSCATSPAYCSCATISRSIPTGC